MRFPPPFRERHRRDNVGGLEEENDKKTVVVILEVFLSLSFTVVYCAEFCGVSCWNNNNVSVSRLLCTYVLGRQREKKAVVFRQKEHSISIPLVYAFAAREAKEDISLLFVAFFFRVERFAEELLVKIYSAHKEKRARSIGYSTTRSWNTITRARNASFDYIRARIFRRRRQRNRETGSFKRERHIPTRIKSEKIIRVGHFLARKYLLSVRPRGPRTSRQQAQCIKKYISIPKKNLEKDLYVRACARASKKTKTKNAHLVG